MQDRQTPYSTTHTQATAYPPRPTDGAYDRAQADQQAVPERSTPPLSPTERRVYDLLLRRLTERQVAEQLGRSHNTVHVHVRNIYRKLGVRTRQQLLDMPYQPAKAVRRNPSGQSHLTK
ncbi:MAG: helix-turn-helix transcriptional regulator [Phycisphaeraceae bacterium]